MTSPPDRRASAVVHPPKVPADQRAAVVKRATSRLPKLKAFDMEAWRRTERGRR